MAPLGTAESTTGTINEDLQHYKKKLNESMPRALFPWLWPVPISNRRGLEMGEISPSLSPLRGLYCSALIDACSHRGDLLPSCIPCAGPHTQMVQTPAAGTSTASVTRLFCQLTAAKANTHLLLWQKCARGLKIATSRKYAAERED